MVFQNLSASASHQKGPADYNQLRWGQLTELALFSEKKGEIASRAPSGGNPGGKQHSAIRWCSRVLVLCQEKGCFWIFHKRKWSPLTPYLQPLQSKLGTSADLTGAVVSLGSKRLVEHTSFAQSLTLKTCFEMRDFPRSTCPDLDQKCILEPRCRLQPFLWLSAAL